MTDKPFAPSKRAVPVVFAIGLLPLVALAYRAGFGDLGAEPVETLLHATGEWGLRMLIASLAITPLRRATGRSELLPHRRSLGLLAFVYAACHLAVFVAFEVEWSIPALGAEILERPYITVGFLAFSILLALTLTSTRAAMRRLGRRWRKLHSLVYAAALLAALHFAWAVKADLLEPLIYSAVVTLLLALRLPRVMRHRAA